MGLLEKEQSNKDAMKAYLYVEFSSFNKALKRFVSQKGMIFMEVCCIRNIAIDKGVNVHSLLTVGILRLGGGAHRGIDQVSN